MSVWSRIQVSSVASNAGAKQDLSAIGLIEGQDEWLKVPGGLSGGNG